MRTIRNTFFAGLLFCLPVLATVFVVQFLVDFAGKPVRTHVNDLATFLAQKFQYTEYIGTVGVDTAVAILSALLVLLAVTLVGLFSRYLLGRWFIDLFEGIIRRVPLVKSIYSAVKEIVARFGADNKENFKQVVLVQFPHPNAWTVAFLTNSDPSELSDKLGFPVVHVFVPTTPNPTGGYFLLVREADIVRVSMSVADAMKLVVSGGALLPAPPPPAAPATAA